MPVDDVNVLVTFYSRSGETERLAVLIAEGAVQAGARIRLRRARDMASNDRIARHPGWLAARDRMHLEYASPTSADAAWADALCLGTPAAPGTSSPELAAWLDSLREETALGGKLASAFTSTYQPRPGSESAVASLQAVMLRGGLLIMPFPAVLGPDALQSPLDDFECARAQGRTLTALARALKQPPPG